MINEQELTKIVKLYKELVLLTQDYLSEAEMGVIDKAYQFGLEVYDGAYRKSGESRMVQPLNVAKIAAEQMALGKSSLVAAILFDAYKLDLVERGPILERFGQPAITVLDGLKRLAAIDTKDISLDFEKKKDAKGKDVDDSKKVAKHSENFRSLLITVGGDVRSVLLRLTYRLYMMRTLVNRSKDMQIRMSRETSQFHAPVAHRLGLYNIKTEMEEISMQYLKPEVYYGIVKSLKDSKEERESFIADFIGPIKVTLERAGFDFEIKGRPKSIYSIWRKIQKQGVSFHQIYDLFAIRVILKNSTDEKGDCWRVYSLITDSYAPNPKRLRDWVSSPKASGYESLHTTVIGPQGTWVEVQIRTERMDEIAEKGHAAHWKYKAGNKTGESESWLARIRELLERPDPKELDQLDQAKAELYSDEIFVFTPKGEIRKMPVGATVLDFAYHLHSNLGNVCTGAKVNGRLQNYRYVLQNGDRVQIETSKTQKPKREWLDICVSQRAKKKIRRMLKDEEYQAAALGKEALQRKFELLGRVFNSEDIENLVQYFGFRQQLELFEAVGDNRVDLSKLKKIFREMAEKERQHVEAAAIEEAELQDFDLSMFQRQDDFLEIDQHIPSLDYTLAQCCNPLPGDTIFGFVTVNKGTKIHKESCPNARDMLVRYPYRVLKANWRNSANRGAFLARVRITGRNTKNLIGDLSSALQSDGNVAIDSFNVQKKGSAMFDGTLVLRVVDSSHLARILKKVHGISGVEKAYRIEK